MFSKFKKRSKKKSKKDSPSPQGVRRHISLPLTDTATQVDFSPKILKPQDSLLNYSVASAPPQGDNLSDGEEGYSTVREGPIIVVTEERRKKYEQTHQEDDAHLRPLPPVPRNEQQDGSSSNERKSSVDRSESSLVSVTPNEEDESEHGGRAGNNQLPNKQDNTVLRSMYAKVNKRGKKIDNDTGGIMKSSSKDHRKIVSTMSVEEEERTTATEDQMSRLREAVVQVPSEVFDLSDSNDSYDDSLVFEEDFLKEELKRVPPHSSPVILRPAHRPPPAPSTSSGHKAGTKGTSITPKSGSNKLSHKNEAKKNSDSKQKKKKPLSPSNATTQSSSSPRTNLNMSDLANLPVYNLNQSSTDGGYILSRADPEGRVEYFRAMPVYSPNNTSPLPPQESPGSIHQGYGVPMGSSTPLRHVHIPSDVQYRSTTPFQFQPHPVPPPPQFEESNLEFSVPLGPLHNSNPAELSTNIPVLPQPSIYSSTHPQNLSTPLQSAASRFSSLQQHQTNLHKGTRLSTSQPQLNTSVYVAGLTEIDQLLSEHQTKIATANNSSHGDSITGGMRKEKQKVKVTFQDKQGTTEADSNNPSSRNLIKKEEQLKLLADENISLKQTIDHLSQQLSTFVPQEKPESTDSNELSPQKLIAETPTKLKRVLDKLISDNIDKNTEIELLKSELSDLSMKNTQLNESYKEELHASDADRQTLRDSLIQMKEDNEELKEKLSATTKKMSSANKEHEQRVYKLKQEVEELKNEVSQFQSNIHTTGHQYVDLHGMVEACSDHTHLSLEGHKRTLAGLERLLHQMMHKSNSLSNQQMAETTRVKQLNDVLSTDLAEIKGKLSVLNGECKRLRKQKNEYEGIVSSLTQDLKFSQARELQAVKCLNDSLKETELSNIGKLKSDYAKKGESLLSQRELQLEDMMKRMDEYRITMKLERQEKLDKLQDAGHRHYHYGGSGHQKKPKESKTITELKSELAKKEHLLDEVYRDKRIAEKQRDILWESKLKRTH